MHKTARLALGAAALAVTATASLQAGLHAQPPARTEMQVLDNASFNVRQITYGPGYKQTPHTVAADRNELVIQISPGQMSATIDGQTTTGHPGMVWWTPKAPSLHAFSNTGKTPVTFLDVQAKPGG